MSDRMEFEPLRLREVILIKPQVFGDDRGFFFESWQQERYAAAGISTRFVQDNHSRSVRHTLRGLHYQVGRMQGKLVRVSQGEVFDVAVDVRRSSPTFGHWVGARLSGENHHMLWIPEGFAHGFVVLSDSADFLYKCTDYWDAKAERSIRWDDSTIGIDWPLPAGTVPLLSARDAAAVSFRDAEHLP